METDQQLWIVTALQVLTVIERIIYYVISWMIQIKNSSCMTDVGNGLLRSKMKVEREPSHTESEMDTVNEKVDTVEE